ncbi:MAG: Flp pilus assembly secretin CpaC [Candidatus Nitrosomirales archaeon]|jgi:Flp pilus assembly secretin CpaC
MLYSANDSGKHGSGSHSDSVSNKKQGGADDRIQVAMITRIMTHQVKEKVREVMIAVEATKVSKTTIAGMAVMIRTVASTNTHNEDLSWLGTPMKLHARGLVSKKSFPKKETVPYKVFNKFL